MLIGLVLLMLLQPLAGGLSDRFGRKPLLVFSAVTGIVFSGWFLQVARTSTDPIAVGAVYLIAMVVITGYLSVNGVAKAEAFPPEVRALGVGLGYAVANSIFGGTSPAAYHAAVAAGHPGVFTLYLSVLLAVTLIAAILMRRSRTTPREKIPS